MICRFVLALSALFWSGTAAAADPAQWTRFRGPNGCGAVEDGAAIPVQWTAADYRWKIALPGAGHSSPVVWADHVVVTSAREKDATQIILCLRTTDGGTVWKREYPASPGPLNRLNAYAASTPAVDGRRVYIAWANPAGYTVLALEQTSGRELWRRDLGPFTAEHGFGASPIVVEDLLIVPNEQDRASSIEALECETGRTRWHAERRTQKAAYATPCIFQPENGKPQLILSSWAHGISSLDPRTGQSYWEMPLFRNRVVGSPIIASRLIFAAAGTGGVGRQMFAIRAGDPQRGLDPQVAYEIKGPIPYVVTPIAKDPLVFLWNDQGIVTCLDAPTGKVRWRQRLGGDFFASPVRVADRLYCISRKGEMVVLAATDQYRLMARFDLGERTQSTPAVAGGLMFIRTPTRLLAIGGK